MCESLPLLQGGDPRCAKQLAGEQFGGLYVHNLWWWSWVMS